MSEVSALRRFAARETTGGCAAGGRRDGETGRLAIPPISPIGRSVLEQRLAVSLCRCTRQYRPPTSLLRSVLVACVATYETLYMWMRDVLHQRY